VLAAYILIALMMEAASPSETSANYYQTTRRNDPEGSHLRVVNSLLFNNDYRQRKEVKPRCAKRRSV
jgi:hypothetical protein